MSWTVAESSLSKSILNAVAAEISTESGSKFRFFALIWMLPVGGLMAGAELAGWVEAELAGWVEAEAAGWEEQAASTGITSSMSRLSQAICTR